MVVYDGGQGCQM